MTIYLRLIAKYKQCNANNIKEAKELKITQITFTLTCTYSEHQKKLYTLDKILILLFKETARKKFYITVVARLGEYTVM